MSAPRFFSRSLWLRFAATAVAILLATGCTVPGKSRLEGPPKDLPPSLSYVTADVLGFWLLEPDRDDARWAALGGAIDSVSDVTDGGITKEGGWIGDHEGVAVRELDLGDTDATTLYFADVRDREALKDGLGADGWDRATDPVDHEADGFVRDSGTYRAAAVYDDAVIAARSMDALETFIDAADEYEVSERKAMREFAVEAAMRTPAAFVFRADLIRTQVRRPVEDDPALLEFARWATDSNVLVALRDGWIGVAPARDESERDGHVRVLGASEWVPDLAPDITLGAADPKLLEELGTDVDIAVALDDPGQHLHELVRAITYGAGQYVTEQDVPDKDDRLELLPILDDLDGPAAIGWQDGDLRIVMRGDGSCDCDLAKQVMRVLTRAGLEAVVSGGDGMLKMVVSLDDAPGPPDVASTEPRTFTGAGKPPRAPFLWFWTRGVGPLPPAAGWMTFDGTDRITLSADVELAASTR